MKHIIIIFLCIFSLTLTTISAQALTEEQKQALIDSLSSTDVWVKDATVRDIGKYNVTEAIPYILADFWTDNLVLPTTYLATLSKLGYSEIIPLAHSVIDSAATARPYYKDIDILEYRVEATEVLFENSDYSTAHYLFELRDSNSVFGQMTLLYLYPDVIKNIPEYAQTAKEELMAEAFTAPSDEFWRQPFAMSALIEIYGDELLEEVETAFIESENLSTKLLAMEILEKEDYEDLENLYKTRLAADTSMVVRFRIIESLLKRDGTLRMSYDIKEIISNIPQTTQHEILNMRRTYFKPAEPDETVPIQTLIDSLDSFTERCYSFGWVSDENYYLSLDTLIQNASNYLSSSDSINCALEIQSYFNSVLQVFSDSAGSYPSYISLDAQRFLYFYPLYILNRLPQMQGNTSQSNRSFNIIFEDLYKSLCESPYRKALDYSLSEITLLINMRRGIHDLNNVPLIHNHILDKGLIGYFSKSLLV